MKRPIVALILAFLPCAALASDRTPAQKRILWAEKLIARNPQDARAHVEMATALARRARETADPAFYAQAEDALKRSLAIAPDNFEARKARVWVLLGKHEFAAALEEARQLNKKMPDDLYVYGFLVDAHVELGNYREAETAAQWMLDLRPGAIPGLTRAAYLRELFGDDEGALELMLQAFQQTSSNESEDRAWILTQMGHLHLARGRVEAAESVLVEALRLFPDYHYALGQMARLRATQGRLRDAAEFERRRYQVAPHPENLYQWAETLHRAGQVAAARTAFTEFERKARAEMDSPDNANRELIHYYLGPGKNPAEALRVAALEVARRRDTYTLDAYAWALFHNGRLREAKKHMDAALAVGVRDAGMLYRAGRIAAGLGQRKQARAFLEQSLAVNPRSESASAARASLASLTTRPPA